MSNLSIRKKSINTWLHTDSVFGDFIISKFYFNSFFAKFQIVEEGNARLEQYEIANITLYDDTDGGVAETFTTITELSLRLEELQYPAFDRTGTSVFPSMEQITNVNVTDVEDGQLLAWDVATSKWLNITIGGLTTPTLQQVTDEGAITTSDIEVGGLLTLGNINTPTISFNSGDNLDQIAVLGAEAGFSSSTPRTFTIPNLDGSFKVTKIINANETATNNGDYTVIANATFTDPTPVEGKGYTVFVRNGTATIGGVGYTAGSLVYRFYYSGAWSSTSIGSSKIPNFQEVLTEGSDATFGDYSVNLAVEDGAEITGFTFNFDNGTVVNEVSMVSGAIFLQAAITGKSATLVITEEADLLLQQSDGANTTDLTFENPTALTNIKIPAKADDGDYILATLDDLETGYIPLSGTPTGNEVTGMVEFRPEILDFKNPAITTNKSYSAYLEIGVQDDEVPYLEIVDTTIGTTNGAINLSTSGLTYSVDFTTVNSIDLSLEEGIKITTELGAGLYSQVDYSEVDDTNKLVYAQRSYVDNELKPIVVSTSVTATLNRVHNVVATATLTDPTPTEGMGYPVNVINGTATIGGVGYTAGSYVFRFYQGGAWGSTSIGGTVPDADASTKGIAKLYTDLLASNTDGSVHQSAIVSGLALKQDKPQILNLTSDYTLTSSTSAQKLFNVGTGGNGAFDATASTIYEFELFVDLSTLSSTSGFFSFSLTGTATYNNLRLKTSATKTALISGAVFDGVITSASAYQLTTASTATVGTMTIKGLINVNGAGTIIPTITLSQASAGVVLTNSYCKLTKI